MGGSAAHHTSFSGPGGDVVDGSGGGSSSSSASSSSASSLASSSSGSSSSASSSAVAGSTSRAVLDGAALQSLVTRWEPSASRPAILLLGPRHAGKTSIVRVVFHKVSPHETLFLEPSTAVEPELIAHNPALPFEVWDIPGDFDLSGATPITLESGTLTLKQLLARTGAAIFVIDAQVPLDVATVDLFRDTVAQLQLLAPGLPIDVFLHKLENEAFQGSDGRLEVQASLQSQLTITLHDLVISIPESIAHHPTPAASLTSPTASSASTSSSSATSTLAPLSSSTASSAPHTVTAASLGYRPPHVVVASELPIAFHPTSLFDHSLFDALSHTLQRLLRPLPALQTLLDRFVQASAVKKAFVFDVVTKLFLATDSSPSDDTIPDLCSDMLDVVVDVSCIYGAGGSGSGSGSGGGAMGGAGGGRTPGGGGAGGSGGGDDTFDSFSHSTIRLSDGLCLLMKSVGSFLALILVAREDAIAGKEGLIDGNVAVLRKALQETLRGPEPPKHHHHSHHHSHSHGHHDHDHAVGGSK